MESTYVYEVKKYKIKTANPNTNLHYWDVNVNICENAIDLLNLGRSLRYNSELENIKNKESSNSIFINDPENAYRQAYLNNLNEIKHIIKDYDNYYTSWDPEIEKIDKELFPKYRLYLDKDNGDLNLLAYNCTSSDYFDDSMPLNDNEAADFINEPEVEYIKEVKDDKEPIPAYYTLKKDQLNYSKWVDKIKLAFENHLKGDSSD